MTSKRLAARKGKELVKKNKVSPSKNPANTVTVASLFKKQLLQQEARGQRGGNVADSESEDDVAFVREEQKSPYFSPKKSPNSSTRSGVDDAGDSTRVGKVDYPTIAGTQRRLSHRLSLKKASQRRNSREKSESVSDSVSTRADNQGDNSASCSDQESKSAKVCQELKAKDTERVSASSVSVKLKVHDGNGLGSLELASSSSVSQMDNVKCQVSLSNKGRLSLKRKIHSQADASLCPSLPKKSSSLPEPATEQQNARSQSAFEEDIVITSSSAAVNLSQASTSEQSESTNASTSHSASVFECVKTPTASTSRSASISERIKSSAASTPKSQTVLTSGPSKSPSRLRFKTYDEDKSLSEESRISAAGEDKAERMHCDTTENDGGENSEESLYRVPYYLENFNVIMKSVFEDDYNMKLFDETDLRHLAAYNNLSGEFA